VSFSSYLALNAPKKYSSTAIFKLQSDISGTNLFQNASSLRALTGIGIQSSSKTVSESQIRGQVFIKKIDAKLNFQKDPYFYSGKPEAVDPIWKSIIKRAIGWQSHSVNTEEAIWQDITKAYSSSITIEETDNGPVKITVRHESAKRAAEIANAIMNEIISGEKSRKEAAQDRQLSYLSGTLANSLGDLEVAQSNLKAFALENSALPLESFVTGSLKLEELREQLNRTNKLYEALKELSNLQKNNKTDYKDYLYLRKMHPIVDQVSFRRVLGQNVLINSWAWPEINSVNAIMNTLFERKNRLQLDFDASQIGAERSSRAAREYSKLVREEKTAEATYTVLLEQVKAKTMIAGYRPSNSEVYEYASPSARPYKPNRILILALGAVLGLFTGCALAFVLAINRGVFFSKESLIRNAQARLNSNSKTLNILRNKKLADVNNLIKKKPQSILRDITVEIHKSGTSQVVVTSSRAKISANDAAIALALNMKSDNIKIAVINFSEKSKTPNSNANQASVGPFIVAESENYVSLLEPEDDLKPVELLNHRDFIKNIQSINSKFDLIFLCADDKIALSLLRAVEGQKIFHLTIARIKRTKSNTLRSMRSLLPIQGLLYV
jgi:uncharacterized protein involved in exopolysaccharide biosynthesis